MCGALRAIAIDGAAKAVDATLASERRAVIDVVHAAKHSPLLSALCPPRQASLNLLNRQLSKKMQLRVKGGAVKKVLMVALMKSGWVPAPSICSHALCHS
jgi:hypothetical protein